MKYFAVLLKGKDADAAKQYHEAHVNYVKQLCEEKKIHLVGKLVDAGGLIIFKQKKKNKLRHG